jgi:hypothetical protein
MNKLSDSGMQNTTALELATQGANISHQFHPGSLGYSLRKRFLWTEASCGAASDYNEE